MAALPDVDTDLYTADASRYYNIRKPGDKSTTIRIPADPAVFGELISNSAQQLMKMKKTLADMENELHNNKIRIEAMIARQIDETKFPDQRLTIVLDAMRGFHDKPYNRQIVEYFLEKSAEDFPELSGVLGVFLTAEDDASMVEEEIQGEQKHLAYLKKLVKLATRLQEGEKRQFKSGLQNILKDMSPAAQVSFTESLKRRRAEGRKRVMFQDEMADESVEGKPPQSATYSVTFPVEHGTPKSQWHMQYTPPRFAKQHTLKHTPLALARHLNIHARQKK